MLVEKEESDEIEDEYEKEGNIEGFEEKERQK